MSKNKKEKFNWLKKLTYHYRLLIINEDTYEEKLNFRLNRLNVFVWISLFAFMLIISVILLISYTPLKHYLTDCTDPKLRKEIIKLKLKTDSLNNVLKINNFYFQQLQKLLKNEISVKTFNETYNRKNFNPDTLKLMPGKIDSILRKEVENREKFKIKQSTNSLNYNFISPVKGIVVNEFMPQKKHYGIDIALKKGTPVKSIETGKVIFSDWTKDGGFTIIIKHPNNIVSVYKHNKNLLRKIGDKVEKGEVVAISGNSGEKTTGPHLHFELWIKETPVNPTDFINFNK